MVVDRVLRLRPGAVPKPLSREAVSVRFGGRLVYGSLERDAPCRFRGLRFGEGELYRGVCRDSPDISRPSSMGPSVVDSAPGGHLLPTRQTEIKRMRRESRRPAAMESRKSRGKRPAVCVARGGVQR